MHSSIRAAVATGVLLLAACTTNRPSSGTDSAASGADDLRPGSIATRAVKRWEHLIERKSELAWEYLSPGYRETHPRDAYALAMNNRPVQWFRVQVYEPGEGEEPSLQCAQPRSCTIKLKVHFRVDSHVMGVGTIDSWNVLKEHWIHVRGQWYLVPEDVVR
jgi:hypothetical protein